MNTVALLALTELLAPGHAKIRARVKLALERPDAYAKKYADDLEDRNVEDEPVDPWLALVCALNEARLLGPVDWKEAADEVHATIMAIAKTKRIAKELFAFYDEDAHLTTKTKPFLDSRAADCRRTSSRSSHSSTTTR